MSEKLDSEEVKGITTQIFDEISKIISTVVTTKRMKPYMLKRCEILRFGFANSPEVNTSLATVATARPTFSPVATVRFAFFFAFSES